MNRDRWRSALVSAVPCEDLAGKRTSPGGSEAQARASPVAGWRRPAAASRANGAAGSIGVSRATGRPRVGHLDDLPSFDCPKVAARLLPELADAELRPNAPCRAQHGEGVDGHPFVHPLAARAAPVHVVRVRLHLLRADRVVALLGGPAAVRESSFLQEMARV